MRTLGGLLQLVGVSTVAYEFHAAIARYRGEPNAGELLLRWLRRTRSWFIRQYRRLRGRPAGQAVNIGAMSANIGITGSAELTVLTGTREHGSFDTDPERVRYLFDRVESAFTRLDGLESTVAATRQQCRQRHEELEGRVEETDQRITSVAEAIEAGSVRLRTFGFVCVLSGIVYASWAPELARTLWGTAVMPATTLSGWAFAWTRERREP